MKKEVFGDLSEKLKGIDYFFISGMSVAIYSKGKREPGDIDIAINEKDIDKFAKSLGVKAEKRVTNKGTFIIDDYGFITNFKGQIVEATSGYPKKRMSEGKFNKLFSMKVKKDYLNKEVFVEPIEELLTQKAFMHREKDIRDLRLLKNIKFNKRRAIELAEDKGNKEEIFHLLKNEGFDLQSLF